MLPDKLGGVFSFVANLLEFRAPDDLFYEALLTRNANDIDDSSDGELHADHTSIVPYRLPQQNLRSVMRRVARALPRGSGVLVTNDWLSLATAGAERTGKAIVNITHGDFDYYYDLAVQYEPVIDEFVTYTDKMTQRLHELLPTRASNIHCIPYGVEIPQLNRLPGQGTVRLLYSGRLSADKGVFDLPKIDAQLRARGLEASWTIQGSGPHAEELRATWNADDRVLWRGRTRMAEVKAQYLCHDILVMPSRAEGLPVSLLEAMAAGCVPVVSDLESGIRSLVVNGVNGYRATPGDIDSFASGILALEENRGRMRAMGQEARRRIMAQHDVRVRSPEYQSICHGALRQTPRWRKPVLRYGSRLDKSWLPNVLVEAYRSRRRRGTPAINHERDE
jgi:glycosyltransferase involved in cell wall biosynthesis